MNKPSDSSRVNNSIHFTFEQSGLKNQPESYVRKDTFDDLQYSVDSISNSILSRDLTQFQQSKIPTFPSPPNPHSPPIIQQPQKRERKAIFQKHTPRNIGVVNNGTGQIEKGVVNVVRETEIVASKRNQIFSNTKQQPKQYPPVESNPNRMNPPPLLPRTTPSAPQQPQQRQTIASINQNRNSVNSVGSVVINQHNSLVINDVNNPYFQNRQSRDVSDTYGLERYGSFQAGDISLIHQNSELDVSQSSNRSMRSTLLEEIRFSEIIAENSKIRKDEGIIISGVGIVESQQGNNLSLNHAQNRVSAPAVLTPNQSVQHSYIQNLSPNSSNIINPEPSQIQTQVQGNFIQQLNQSPSQLVHPQPHPPQKPSFLKPISNIAQNNIIPQTHPTTTVNDFTEDIHHPSNLSIHSIHSDIDLKSSTNSSNLLNSQSMNRALGNLSQYIFIQPVIQSRIPQLLQQCWRLNSISINLKSPHLALDSIRHKEIIRNQIFQSLLATQTLQKIRDQLQNRQIKQKKLLKSFHPSAFLQGEWYQANKIKNTLLITPKQSHCKRTVDYQRVKQTLRNSFEVLKYYQGFIQYFRIQSSEEFKQKYIQLRNSLFEIFNNLNKMCEDLHMKSIHNYLPEVYFKIYEYLKSTSGIKSAGNLIQINQRIQEREIMLQQIQSLRKEKDPLLLSQLGKEVENKIRNDINSLKSAIKK